MHKREPIAVCGEFCADCLYTLDEIARRMNRSKDWVYYVFIKPTNLKTKKRRMDSSGAPIPGVVHFSHGGARLISGAALAAWVTEHATQETD